MSAPSISRSRPSAPQLSGFGYTATSQVGVRVLAGPVRREASEVAARLAAGVAAVASAAFFTVVLQISLDDPDYFERLLVSDLKVADVDPIITGATQKGDPFAGGEAPIPVPAVARPRPPLPEEFEIVMIFGEEALLATTTELWRIKVGSVLPGLGEILAIEENGTVRTSQATLRQGAR